MIEFYGSFFGVKATNTKIRFTRGRYSTNFQLHTLKINIGVLHSKLLTGCIKKKEKFCVTMKRKGVMPWLTKKKRLTELISRSGLV